jgi:hypothetical protein
MAKHSEELGPDDIAALREAARKALAAKKEKNKKTHDDDVEQTDKDYGTKLKKGKHAK